VGSLGGDYPECGYGLGGGGEGLLGSGETIEEGSVPTLAAGDDPATAGTALFLDATKDRLAADGADPLRGDRHRRPGERLEGRGGWRGSWAGVRAPAHRDHTKRRIVIAQNGGS
jgi:hypothetical protein